MTRDMSDGAEVTITFSESAYRTLEELAESTHMTIVEAVRDAITVYWWLALEYGQGSNFLVRNGAKESDVEMPSLRGMSPLRPTAAPPGGAVERLPNERRREGERRDG